MLSVLRGERGGEILVGSIAGSFITALIFIFFGRSLPLFAWHPPVPTTAPGSDNSAVLPPSAPLPIREPLSSSPLPHVINSKAQLFAALETQPGFTSHLNKPMPPELCPLTESAWAVARNSRHNFDLVTYGSSEFISRYCLRGGDSIFFEEHETDLIKTLLRSSQSSSSGTDEDPFFSRPWLFDVGANLGVHTVSVGAAGFGVIAIEANPTTAARLRCSISLNALPHVALLNVAVVGTDGPPHMCIQTPEEANRGTAFITGAVGGVDCAAGTLSVPTLTLDGLFASLPASLPAPAVLKMDIEGFEVFALRAANSWLKRTPPPYVLIEVQPDLLARAGVKFQDLINFWLERGYHGWVPVGGTRQPLPEVVSSDFDTEEKLGGFKWRMLTCNYNMVFTLAAEFPENLPQKICENTR